VSSRLCLSARGALAESPGCCPQRAPRSTHVARGRARSHTGRSGSRLLRTRTKGAGSLIPLAGSRVRGHIARKCVQLTVSYDQRPASARAASGRSARNAKHPGGIGARRAEGRDASRREALPTGPIYGRAIGRSLADRGPAIEPRARGRPGRGESGGPLARSVRLLGGAGRDRRPRRARKSGRARRTSSPGRASPGARRFHGDVRTLTGAAADRTVVRGDDGSPDSGTVPEPGDVAPSRGREGVTRTPFCVPKRPGAKPS
jgi:hypothetical protein